MNSFNETDGGKGKNDAILTNNDPKNNNNNNAMATSTKDEPKQKKKKPMQHLLAGGTAGLVESSICHPLDTIKTRMQLRRQNTMRKRALSSMSSMRDVAGSKKGALHRTSSVESLKAKQETVQKKKTSTGASSSSSVAKDRLKNASAAAAKSETVRVKPDVSKVRSAAAAEGATKAGAQNALHDVGWKQRTVASSAKATATETVAKATTTVLKSSSASSSSGTVVAPLGPFGTARRIVEREGPLALYKGLTAVYTGIVPKMAIRFVSFEYYRDVLGGWYGRYAGINNSNNPATSTITPPSPPPSVTFFAGLMSGLTEAVLIVTPAEVCKIRMQSQYHSLMDPSQMNHMKYKNVVQTAALVVKEEGIGALYKGVVPTMLRQGCNQAVNFTVYNWSKKNLLAWKKKKADEQTGGKVVGDVQLDHWQTLTLGGLSGGMGPLVNNPLGEFLVYV